MEYCTIQLQYIKKLYETYTCDYKERVFKFDVILSKELLTNLKTNQVDFTVQVKGKHVREGLHNNSIGKKSVILIEQDSLKCCHFIYETWDSFLESEANLLNSPSCFWIISESLYADSNAKGEEATDTLNNYRDICAFIKLMVDISDYQDMQTTEVLNSVIFLHKSKLEIITSYKSEDLLVELKGFNNLLKMFRGKLHREHKISIFKEVIYSLLSNISKEQRLKYLLKNFEIFSSRFIENYKLFISEFSFDSVRSEYEEKKREYITKLNEVLASVQTKMLGIPISLGFLSLKFDANDVESIINSHVALKVGIVVYCIMMFILICSQQHTLNAVKDEYTSLLNRLKYRYYKQHNEVETIKTFLDKRYLFQWRTLVLFHVFTFCLIFALFFVIK